MRQSEIEKNEARETLSKMLKPGDTVYTILQHVSRSGMSREIRILVPVPANEKMRPVDFWHPNYAVAKLLGEPMSKDRDAVKVTGCGMDMGFHIVSNLSYALFPDGFGCVGENCPSNDHSNGDRDYTVNVNEGITSDKDGNQREVKTHWHKEAGYALKHRWL